MTALLHGFLIGVAVVVGYRYGRRTTAAEQRVHGWFDGWESGIRHTVAAMEAEGLLMDPVISVAHRDAQVNAAREGWQ